jgi:predicted esterase YcpF (UPF0227 family)
VKSKCEGCERASSDSRLLFYFNGFNSAIPPDWSDSEKIVALEAYARARSFRFVPHSVDYRRAQEQARDILAGLGEDVTGVIFSGSSMGGWFARVMQLLLARARPGLPVEALAFNPAFDVRSHGHLLLGPQVNQVTLEEYEWTTHYGAGLRALEDSVDYDAPLPFFVYVDKGDEVIGWRYSAARHIPIAHFVAFEGGSHSFEHAAQALQDFDARSDGRRDGPRRGDRTGGVPDNLVG